MRADFFKIYHTQTGKILLPAIAGTSAMTLFSYLVSESENENFREPEVLAALIKRLPISCSKDVAPISGWIIHYTVGIMFVSVYNEIWKRKKVKPTCACGVLLGAASGLAGIIGWKSTFEIHPDPPAKNLKKFFGHLLLAHIVFGLFSALTYQRTR